MHYKKIPASLYFETPNPGLRLGKQPVFREYGVKGMAGQSKVKRKGAGK
jgi:hypothetical protein